MANTSRKRPPPPSLPTSSLQQQQQCSGIDALLAKYARHLPPGASVTVQLIKGPTSSSVDPVAARKAAVREAKRAAARAARMSNPASDNNNAMSNTWNVSSFQSSGMSSGNDDSDTNNATDSLQQQEEQQQQHHGITPMPFPRIAKFTETVTHPDFQTSLKDGRMYEEEVPKVKDESDEDESSNTMDAITTTGGSSMGDPSSIDASSTTKTKAIKNNTKRRWRRYDPRPRRWVLQEKSEFFDKIRKRRMRTSTSSSTGENDNHEDSQPGVSNQYHGVVEANTSKYVILSVAPTTTTTSSSANNSRITSNNDGVTTMSSLEQICVQPIYGFHTFNQPYKFASLTMEEAEHAIETQRQVMSRYMLHGRMASQNAVSSGSAALLATGIVTGGSEGTRGRGLTRSIGPPPKAMSRARLLGKLVGGVGRGNDEEDDDDDDDDDVMGDVRFSSSRVGGTSKGRRELLSSLGDEGITADDDGVLGGANDSEFGGRRRFARISSAKDASESAQLSRGGGKNITSIGFEAAAMEEGFYQRDVAAEYEELDYDAEEQFDDDDVNVGENDLIDDGGGYGGDYHDSGDDDILDSDEDDDAGSGSDTEKGMATASGLKAMLAKARGESPVPNSGFESSNSSVTGIETNALDAPANLSGGISGTEITKRVKIIGEISKKIPSSPSLATTTVVEKDKDGKRLITLEAVRREIWLNNGAITSKRLTKKFDVTKKNPERQALFKTIIMELCTIKKDADGNKLVLKQHYSKL